VFGKICHSLNEEIKMSEFLEKFQDKANVMAKENEISLDDFPYVLQALSASGIETKEVE
jgi:hypothetical protein